MNQIMKVDLTGTDVDFLTKGNATLILYEDLIKFNSIVDMFGKLNNVILLFPVQNETSGHWICISIYPEKKIINHWDSYGMNWMQERGYTKNNYVKQNLLGLLYTKAQYEGWTITWNKYKLQKMKNGISTCGRWSCMRSRMSYLNNDEFAKLFLNQKMNPDWLITCLTFTALDEDENDEETIIRSFGLKQKLD